MEGGRAARGDGATDAAREGGCCLPPPAKAAQGAGGRAFNATGLESRVIRRSTQIQGRRFEGSASRVVMCEAMGPGRRVGRRFRRLRRGGVIAGLAACELRRGSGVAGRITASRESTRMHANRGAGLRRRGWGRLRSRGAGSGANAKGASLHQVGGGHAPDRGLSHCLAGGGQAQGTQAQGTHFRYFRCCRDHRRGAVFSGNGNSGSTSPPVSGYPQIYTDSGGAGRQVSRAEGRRSAGVWKAGFTMKDRKGMKRRGVEGGWRGSYGQAPVWPAVERP